MFDLCSLVCSRYISTVNGKGNAYGLAVVCAVTFPFIFYGRLYWPIPPVSSVIVSISTSFRLVLTDPDPEHLYSSSSPRLWYVSMREVSCTPHMLIRWCDLLHLFIQGSWLLLARYSLPLWIRVLRNRRIMGT